jgi:hypothetical protein
MNIMNLMNVNFCFFEISTSSSLNRNHKSDNRKSTYDLDIMSAIRIKKDSPLANVGYAVGINPTAQSHNQGGES